MVYPNKQDNPAAAIPVYPVVGGVAVGPTTPLPVTAGSSGGLQTTTGVSSAISTPTVTAGAYTTGMSMGGVLALTSQPNQGIVQNVAISLASGSYTGSFDVYLFNAAPSAYVDHVAVTLSAADAKKLIGVVHAVDVTPLGGALALVQAQNVAEAYALAAAGTTLYALMVLRGSVTLAGTGDVQFMAEVVK